MGLRMEITRFEDTLRSILHGTLDDIVTGGTAIAAAMEDEAKKNAPWTDRTGNARRTLTGFVLADEYDCVNIGLMGRMSYSPQLETGYGRRYAIILPTVERWTPHMMYMIRDAVARQGGLRLG